MAGIISLNVWSMNDFRWRVAIHTWIGSTVAELKLLITMYFNVPVHQQRLFRIGRGLHELQDDRTIASYGLQDGHIVYLVRRSVPATSSTSASVAAAAVSAGGNSTPDISSGVGSVQSQGFGGGSSSPLSPGLDGSSDGTVPEVLINVQYSSETRFAIRVRPELTVSEFKGLITQLRNIPVNEQRLIYSGQFLQDDKTIGSYGIRDSHVIHLARRFVPTTSSASTSVAAAAPPLGGNSTPDILTGAGSVQNQGFGGEASSLFGGGLPGFGQLGQQISGNPNMLSEMMNIPATQNLLNDPHITRNVMMNNPWICEVEFAHVLNGPSALRRRMEAMRNLEQVRAMVRDRSRSNIESLPEGYNMLRQSYENEQEPVLNASSMAGLNGYFPVSNPFSPLFGNHNGGQVEDRSAPPFTMSTYGNGGSSVPNADPLPNPWGPNAAIRGFLSNNTLRNRTAGANVPGFAGLGIPGLLGLHAQSSSFMDPATRIQALQNPATFQIIDEVIYNDPQPSGLVDSSPQVLEALQHPEMSMSHLASRRRLQQSGPSLSALLGSMPRGTGQTAGGGVGMFDGQTAGGAAVPPEELYANQLLQLQEMGFTDTRENIQALLATSGNVRAAVQRLLQYAIYLE